MRINEKNYNPAMLSPENKQVFNAYDMAAGDALNKEFIIEELMGLHSGDVFTTMKREIAEEVFDNIEAYLSSRALHLLAGLIDNQEEISTLDDLLKYADRTIQIEERIVGVVEGEGKDVLFGRCVYDPKAKVLTPIDEDFYDLKDEIIRWEWDECGNLTVWKEAE